MFLYRFQNLVYYGGRKRQRPHFSNMLKIIVALDIFSNALFYIQFRSYGHSLRNILKILLTSSERRLKG